MCFSIFSLALLFATASDALIIEERQGGGPPGGALRDGGSQGGGYRGGERHRTKQDGQYEQNGLQNQQGREAEDRSVSV